MAFSQMKMKRKPRINLPKTRLKTKAKGRAKGTTARATIRDSITAVIMVMRESSLTTGRSWRISESRKKPRLKQRTPKNPKAEKKIKSTTPSWTDSESMK